MTMRTVYLAGPIAGCDRSEANDWRFAVSLRLELHNIHGISPLRCEPIGVGERYVGAAYRDERFGSARAICSKNLHDTRNCDMVLCYLPRELNDRRPSYGTIMELAWAHALNKSTILVTDCPTLRAHPVVNECASWLLETLEQAEDVIIGILGDYALKQPKPKGTRKARR